MGQRIAELFSGKDGDINRTAYSELRLAGYTVDVSPEDDPP